MRFRTATICTAVASVCLLPVAGGAAPAQAAVREAASEPVTFKVVNTNGSLLPCRSDGAVYEVKGDLVGPRSVLSRGGGRGATLYLHGFGYGEWLWHFTPVAGFDYAVAQARAGHVSVVIDRLGYGASGHPPGDDTCLGADADVAHQIVSKLRSGEYTAGGKAGPRFKRIALVGHSMAAEIANIESASFGDVDALAVVSHSFTNLPLGTTVWGSARVACQGGGEPAFPGGPGAYAYFGQTPAEAGVAQIPGATPAVRDAATRLFSRDPCGDSASVVPAILLQKKTLPKITVPVLVICGKDDVFYADFGCAFQRGRYAKARSRTLAFVPGAGHAITLGSGAGVFRAKLGRWLSEHGF
jgi:pimeloyl-ACP methyl ester carboxylesterase